MCVCGGVVPSIPCAGLTNSFQAAVSKQPLRPQSQHLVCCQGRFPFIFFFFFFFSLLPMLRGHADSTPGWRQMELPLKNSLQHPSLTCLGKGTGFHRELHACTPPPFAPSEALPPILGRSSQSRLVCSPQHARLEPLQMF